MEQKEILVGGAVVYKKIKEKPVWFLVKQKEDSEWEIAKTNARRGESSVRAVIRMMGEQAAMNVKVIEEVGRSAGAALVGTNTLPQRTLFYLMYCKDAQEVLAFADTIWLDYARAVKKLKTKKEISILKSARDLLKDIDKKKKAKKK